MPAAWALAGVAGVMLAAPALRPMLPPRAPAPRSGISTPALRPLLLGLAPPDGAAGPIDLYPATLATRVTEALPHALDLPAGAGRALRARVHVVLSDTGAVTLAELLVPSGVPAFDTAVIDTLARFGSGGLPGLTLPRDAARRALVTTRGVMLDVRPPPPPARVDVGPHPLPKEP